MHKQTNTHTRAHTHTHTHAHTRTTTLSDVPYYMHRTRWCLPGGGRVAPRRIHDWVDRVRVLGPVGGQWVFWVSRHGDAEVRSTGTAWPRFAQARVHLDAEIATDNIRARSSRRRNGANYLKDSCGDGLAGGETRQLTSRWCSLGRHVLCEVV